MVAVKHPNMAERARSEPEIFIEIADRAPEWCVVVGLVGSGQEIHMGEEGGIVQWANAIAASPKGAEWTVHGPPAHLETFSRVGYRTEPALNLDRSLRSHLASRVHEYVAGLVAKLPPPIAKQAELASLLASEGHDLRITRDIAAAKKYLRDRYAENPDARFGLAASSRDKDLFRFGIHNDFQTTKRLKFGPWYGDNESAPGGHSCRLLIDCVTEFGAQGLELDAVLLAWGTDFTRASGAWNIDKARKYQPGRAPVRDPLQLRANAYRVLLTRARDATIVFVPELPELTETFDYLVQAGFRRLESDACATNARPPSPGLEMG